jgi:hypothetical protein
VQGAKKVTTLHRGDSIRYQRLEFKVVLWLLSRRDYCVAKKV